ncbi:unnamed protein product, partial [Ectocarpus sp. 13 AM-2016]
RCATSLSRCATSSLTSRCDGTVLYGLLEVLSKQSLAVLGKVKPERNKIKKIANMNIVWKYLGNTVKLVGIGPTDIVDGNVTLTLGMIWSLIVFFMALDLGDAGDGLTVLKKRIMEWMTRRTKDFPDVEVTNFTTSLADGRVLLAILNDYDPSQSPYEPSRSPADNLRRAFEDFQRLYGVGSILDPDDPQCCEDEKANITYLAELMKAMPEHEDDDGEGGGRRGRKGVREAAAVVNTRQAAIKISEDSFPETVVGRLRELCAFGPGDGAACASRVAEMMRDAGLGDVVEPSQGREDASMRGDPIVVGEKAGPPGSPTVLFYASYGTVDESSEAGPAEGSGSLTQGSTINNDIERWASDPLCLTPTKRPSSSSSSSPSQAAGSPKGGECLAARGAAQDKANVVCQIAAVEAMLEGGAGLPCGVKVVVGGTPPPGSLSGDAPLEVADRLADFLRAHPSLAGLPDLVVVSEPAGSRLAPDNNALLVGCRGFAFLEVAVTTFEDGSGHRRGCADYGGPLIDPARVLANIVASLHHPETGELRVEGVSDLAPKEGEALAEGIGGLRYGEGQLRRDTGYSPEVACARGVCYKPGGSSPDKPTTTTLASVAEQLALLPAVTVTSISTKPPSSSDGRGGGSLLGSRFPATATAGVHMCLPPGAEYASAVRAFQSHCTKHAPHGAKVRFDKVLGRAGWLAPPSGSPLVSGVLASLREEDGGETGGPVEGGGRETVLTSDPGFSAIPSAFARALPDSAVVGLGVHDPESKGGAANESVLVDDLKGFVRSAVRLVHSVAESGGKEEKAGSSPGGVKEGAGEDTPTAYSNRFIDDLDRRNAVNKLRGGGKLSNVSSPTGSANTTPRGTNSRGITHSSAGGSPVRSRSPASRSPSRFSTLERNLEREGGGGGAGGFSAGGVGGGPLTPNAKHPLSPNRPPSSATTAGLSPADSASIAELLQSSPLAPRLPPAPSAAMAAFAAAALGDAAGGGGGREGAGGFGVVTPPPPGGSAGMAGNEDDDKVGGGTPETVLAEINELRADPKGYAAKLEALQEFYDKGMYQSPTGPPVQTTEGVKPLLEVVAMLKTTQALAPLESKEGMQQAAADHVKDLAETSRTGHSGSDGSGAADRMNRYGQFFQVGG